MKARILQFLALAALLCFASAQARAQAEVEPDQFDNPNAVAFTQSASPVAANSGIAKDSLPIQVSQLGISKPANGNRTAAAAHFLRANYLGATGLVLILILQILVASSSARAQRMLNQHQEIVSARVSRRGF